MTQYVIANNVNTQLAASASSGATTLTLASSTNLPTLSSGQIMPLTLNDAATGQNYEIVYVTAITGVTLTVIRAQEGTGALTWNVGDYAFCGPTAGTVATSQGNPANPFAVAPASASNQAVPLAQAQSLQSGTIGQMTNGSAKLTAAGNSFTFTADQITVGSALNGLQYHLTAVTATVNTSTTGIGGMNTGTPTANGFVGVYLLYNPTTTAYGLLAVNEANALLPMICAASSIPTGYTASCLIGAYWTSATGTFNLFQQVDRRIYNAGVVSYSTSAAATLTGFQYVNVPVSAFTCSGSASITNSAASVDNVTIYPWSTGGPGAQGGTRNSGTSGANTIPISDLLLDRRTAPHTSYVTFTSSAGTVTLNISMNSYTV